MLAIFAPAKIECANASGVPLGGLPTASCLRGGGSQAALCFLAPWIAWGRVGRSRVKAAPGHKKIDAFLYLGLSRFFMVALDGERVYPW